MQIAELFASLGIRANQGEWSRADRLIKRTSESVDRFSARAVSSLSRIGAGIVAYLGFRSAKESLIDFNSSIEDTKNQIAGMLALSKKTSLTDELANADALYASLQKRAASLPGTTAEYARMAGMIAQPLIDAKLSMQDLEDLTVSAVVAAKALGVNAEVAARDIDQALRGQFHGVDQLTGKLLGSTGFKGEAGRAKFNALPEAQRAQRLKAALTQPQIAQLAAAQGNTFSGVTSTLQDTVQQFFGKVGLPLFRALTEQVKQLNAWFDKNRETIGRVAAVVGGVLAKAFAVAQLVVGKVVEAFQAIFADKDIRAAIGLIAGAIETVVAVFVLLLQKFGPAKYLLLGPILAVVGAFKAFGFVINHIGDAFAFLRDVALAVIHAIEHAFTAVAGAVSAVWQGVVGVFRTVAETIMGIVDKVESVGNRIAGLLPGRTKVVNVAKKILGGGALETLGAGASHTASGASTSAPTRTPIAAGGGGTNVNITGNPTTINVQSNASDPRAVATEVRKAIDDHWSTQMGAAYAGTGGTEGG